MSRPESLRADIKKLNDRMWAEAQPLEKQLRELEAEYQAARRRPVTDVVARGVAALLESRIRAATDQLNAVYDEWAKNLMYFAPPPSATAGDWTDQIVWPSSMAPELRTYLR
jgi:hypothetical protein